MFRALVFFTILGAAVWGAVSLSDHPGSVSLQWGGYRVDTSFAVLLAVVLRGLPFVARTIGQVADGSP